MNKTIPSQTAKQQFFSIVDKVARLGERYVVTKNGMPKAVVMSADEFESWTETLELMSNPKAVKALEQGLKEAKVGRFHSLKEAFGQDK